MTLLNDLAEKIHQTAVDHGFWENPRDMGEMIALMHSELSEALEEHRANKPPAYYMVTVKGNAKVSPEVNALLGKIRGGNDGPPIDPALTDDEYRTLVTAGIAKPEGAGVELVDCIIRMLDTMSARGIDIDHEVARLGKFDDLIGINSLNAYAALLADRVVLADNFGDNISSIHNKLSIAWNSNRDGHFDSMRLGFAAALSECIVFARSLHIDVDATVREKMTYNDSRPYKHNKEYY